MVTNANNARIWGGDNDSIWLAPVGTTLPTTIDAVPGAGFEDVGWLHEDGITETANGSKEVIRGHQGAGVVRTRMSETGTSIAFTALEDKAQTNSLRYHEKSSEVTAGVRKVTRGAGQRVSARAAVIDLYDIDNETIRKRLIIPRLEIVPTGDKTYSNADISGFGFESEIIGDYEVFETVTETPEDPEA